MLGVVGGVGGEVAKANTGGEEDLSDSRLPDCAGRELVASPCCPQESDSFTGILKRERPADEDNGGHNWETHRPVDNTTGQTNTAKDGNPDQEPDERAPSHRLAQEANTRVFRIRHDLFIVKAQRPENRIDVVDHVAHVEFLNSALPRQGTAEGVSEVIHNPGKIDREVLRDDKTDQDGADSHTLQAAVDVVECDHCSTTIRLADGDFENERRNRDKENGQQVWDEPLQPVVVVHDRGVPDQVSLSSAASHGGQQEGSPRGPLVTTILRLRGRREKPGDGLPDILDKHHGESGEDKT